VVVVIIDPESLDKADVLGKNVHELLPGFDYHALFILDEDDFLENLDVLALVVIVDGMLIFYDIC
jgi:hypothetical protein